MRRLLLLLSVLALAVLAACGAETQPATEEAALETDSPLVTVYSSPT